jgi:hypothetical protein
VKWFQLEGRPRSAKHHDWRRGLDALLDTIQGYEERVDDLGIELILRGSLSLKRVEMAIALSNSLVHLVPVEHAIVVAIELSDQLVPIVLVGRASDVLCTSDKA